MPAKQSAPRQKRGAPTFSGPKKKQSVAAKKKHVRELANKGQWAEIERLYGKKILDKAKTYAEKNRVTKTPQEIAREVLIKNGLLSSASQVIATIAPAPAVNREVARTPESVPRVDVAVVSSSPEALTKEQQELVETRRREALERRRLPSNSPGTLTKEQQERIEKRRREALAKQRRASKMVHVQPPVVIQPDPIDKSRRGLQPSIVPRRQQIQPTLQASWREARTSTVQPQSKTHRVVTPENLPTANQEIETEQTRPEYFWDDLEAAAEIVQWENEHMAEVALVEPSTNTSRNLSRDVGAVQHELGKQMQRSLTVSAIPSISQELAAAAEIIRWEKEHEVSPEVSACSRRGDSTDSDPDIDVPQFQLLPVHVCDDSEQQEQNAIDVVRHQKTSVKFRQTLPSNDLQMKSKSHRKRQLAAAPPPALPHSSAVCSNMTNPGGENRCHSSPSENVRDPAAEFIDKHLLVDKFELQVLEFLEMMLA